MIVLIDGMDEPFRFEFPVSKNTLGDLVLGPGRSRYMIISISVTHGWN